MSEAALCKLLAHLADSVFASNLVFTMDFSFASASTLDAKLSAHYLADISAVRSVKFMNAVRTLSS